METIDLSARTTGVEVAGKVSVVGAVKRPTKRHTEEDPHYWYAIKFQGESGDGDVLMAFCDSETAQYAAVKLSKSGAAFLADVVLRISEANRSLTLNVESLA